MTDVQCNNKDFHLCLSSSSVFFLDSPVRIWSNIGFYLKRSKKKSAEENPTSSNILLTSLTSFSISLSPSESVSSLWCLCWSFRWVFSVLCLPSSSSFVLSNVPLDIQSKVLCPLRPAKTNTGHVRLTSPYSIRYLHLIIAKLRHQVHVSRDSNQSEE